MLEPQSRRLLLQSLQPPEGYRLDWAVGTTYSLDLLALLSAPVAFAFSDCQDGDGRPVVEPLALLKAVRQYANRTCLFCQAGKIHVPRTYQPLLADLEDSIVEANAPRGGSFRPKLWFLRYLAEDGAVQLRFLFATARAARAPGQNDLFPYWVVPDGTAKIERHILALPHSREIDRQVNLRGSLVVYRMVFGQNRQEDLVEFLMTRLPREEVERVSHYSKSSRDVSASRLLQTRWDFFSFSATCGKNRFRMTKWLRYATPFSSLKQLASSRNSPARPKALGLIGVILLTCS